MKSDGFVYGKELKVFIHECELSVNKIHVIYKKLKPSTVGFLPKN